MFVLPLEESEFPWKKNLYVIWTAQFIAMIGMNGCVPFLPLYIRELGIIDLSEAKRWSGLIFAAPFVLSFFFTPFWGYLGDKYSKKFMVVRAIVGLTIVMFLMGLARNVWQLFLLRILQGAISGFIAANLALVTSTTPKKYSGYAIALLQTSTTAGVTIGPVVGGVIADTIGIRESFFLVTAFCFISAVIVITMVKEGKKDFSLKQKNFRQNIGAVWENKRLLHFFAFIMLCQGGIGFTTPILAYYMEALHTPAQYLSTITGILIGTVGLLMTIFTPFWGKRNDRFGYEKNLRLALPVVTVVTIAQSFVPHYIYLFPLRLTIGIFSGAIVPTLYSALHKNSPVEMQGSIMGFASSAALLGNLIGPFLCSLIASSISIEVAFWVGGSMIGMVYFDILRWKSDSSL